MQKYLFHKKLGLMVYWVFMGGFLVLLLNSSGIYATDEIGLEHKNTPSQNSQIAQYVKVIERSPADSGEAQLCLEGIGKPAVKPLLDLIANSKSEPSRRVALWTLGTIADIDALPEIVKLIDDRDETMRATALRILGFYGDEGSVKKEWILKGFQDKSLYVRIHAAIAVCYVRCLSDDVIGVLLEMLTEGIADRSLKLDDVMDIEQALMITTGYDPGFDTSANTATHLNAVIAFIKWYKEQKNKSRQELEVDCLKRAGYLDASISHTSVNPASPNWLVGKIGSASKDKKWLVRLIAAKLLKQIGDRRVTPYLFEILRNPSEECSIRDSVAALRALEALTDPAIVKTAVDSFGKNPIVDKTANRLLIKITGHYVGMADTDEQRAKTAKNWLDWYKLNGPYLQRNDACGRFEVDEDAKKAQVPARYWERISKQDRDKWPELGKEKQAAILGGIKSEIISFEKIQDEAWEAGVALKLWMLIPESARASWDKLSEEEREKLIHEAEEKLLEQEKPNSESKPEDKSANEKDS